jgi:hypothetical protein
MSMRSILAPVVGIALASGMVALAVAQVAPPAAPPPQTLRPASSFQSIQEPRARSLALFEEVGKVLQSPRCLNCHPAGDRPTQTDHMRPHTPMAVRGEDGRGAPGMPCTACHHAANFDQAHVPGHPQWHLAPLSMAWQGRSLGQICEQLKDRSRNGDKDLAALVHHMKEDTLVGWGWNPGIGRTPAPGTQQAFGDLFQAWVDSGAVCPSP